MYAYFLCLFIIVFAPFFRALNLCKENRFLIKSKPKSIWIEPKLVTKENHLGAAF